MALKAYQQRVMDEKQDLDEKIDKLDKFVQSDEYAQVPPQEAQRLLQQLAAMREYNRILEDRIANF